MSYKSLVGRVPCGTSFQVVTSARREDVKEVDWVKAPDSLFAE